MTLNRLQYISQGQTAAQQLQHIRTALDAGCRWIQLRWKGQQAEDLLALALQVKALCLQHNALLIVNDHAAIAQAIDADGLHLGLDDMPVAEARQLLGPGKIIGGTANTLADIRQRVAEQCDYIGLGPFRFTTTKEKLSPVLGLKGYRQIMQALSASGVTLPVYAIGGLEPGDIADLMEAGVYGIAVSGMISQATDPQSLIQNLNQQLYATTSYSR